MSHSTTLVVLDGAIPEDEVEGALIEALEPFDENTETDTPRWDWWVVGGRWTQRVLNATETIHHPGNPDSNWAAEREPWDEEAGGVDIVRKRDLIKYEPTFAFLDKDGKWHERGTMGWFGMVSDEQDNEAWEATLDTLIKDVDPNDWLVVVDVHI